MLPSVRARARRPTGETGWAEHLAGFLHVFGVGLVAIGLLLIFGLSTPDFLSRANIDNILIQTSIVGVAAIGETMVMLMGGIDLSIGSIILVSAVITGALTTNHGLGAWPAIGAGLLAAAGIGLINGIFIAGIGIEPIIVTLGTLIAAQGLGQAILANEGSWIQVTNPFFFSLATNQVFSLPAMAVVMLALYAVAAVVLRDTALGRHIYAAGGNRRAARLAGIPIGRVVVATYALCGLCAGVAGMLEIAQLGIVSQNVGDGMQFNAITAVLVGGISLSGGKGRVERTLLGVMIVGTITNFLTFRGVSAYYEQAITGGIILAAVFLDHATRRRAQ